MSAVMTRPKDLARDVGEGQPALFLDFDGTLVEIAARPDAVAVDPSLARVLARLRDRLGGALALVSGRSIAVIDRFLTPERFDVAGLHGAEHRLAGRLSPCRPDEHPRLRNALAALQDRFAGMAGVLVEDKGCSFALHWRLAPDRAAELLEASEAAALALGDGYRLQRGKAVAEILPAAAAKGRVIERFLADPAYRGRRPVFVGDDLTDEGGFAVVQALGGVAIRVGEGPTVARKRLVSPASLRSRLAAWAETGAVTLDGIADA